MPLQNAPTNKAGPVLRRSFARFIGGIAAAEFAFVVPVLLLMMVGTIDLGRGFYRKMQVREAAQAGAQWATLHGFDSTSISTAITSATSFPGVAASPAPSQSCGCAATTGVTPATCGSQCPDTTDAGTYVTTSALPYPLVPASFTLAAQTTVRIQ